ncbi:MAG: MBL fold metallo-hydrolase [Firmicutes bacterium]|nr:MBL fold metallo-hydrolase [Bacillota bacterium]
MYELVQVGENSFYIESPAKVGIVRTGENEVCLIDSGSDKDGGKKVLRILEQQGWTLKAIFNTHSHADHIGGNKFLQDRTGCKVYAPGGMDWAFTNVPAIEPAFLYGGFSPANLRHKFVMAQPSAAEPLTEDVLPEGMELLDLKGHGFDMVGFRTADDVVYLADCVSSPATLEKYGITFNYDIASHLETLGRVKEMKAKIFVGAHIEPMEDVAELAQYNIDKTLEVASKIVGICRQPHTFEEVLQKLFLDYNMKMNFDQYVLIGSTVRSYMAWLKNEGRLDVDFVDAKMLWKTVQEI